MKNVKNSIFSANELETLSDFVNEKILPGSKERDESESFPVEIFRELHTLGWTRCFIPEAQGGLGANTADLTQIFRKVAYASPGIATSMAGNMLAFVPILLRGSDELRDNVIHDYQNNFSLSSFCFTEPDHGSDVMRIETNATPAEGGYLITGKKCFVTNANYAKRYLVVAKIKGMENPKRGMGLFLIEGRPDGFSVGSAYSKLGLRDSNTGEVFFDQVFVPTSHLIGKEGEGFEIACKSIQRSRIMLAASAVGLCDRAGDLARDYLKQRVLYGKPLLTQQAITNLLGQLYAEKEALWLLIQSAAEAWDAEDFSFKLSSMAKLMSGQLAMRFASACLELFGGWGCTKEYEIERVYRDAKFYDIMEGPSFVQLAILAKELFPELQTIAKQKAA
jgi:alkylation response protein AidB-like acyl-CoA dehydrogenase